MEKYESKQVRINRPAAIVYESLSDFSRFTPILADKVEGWDATSNTCAFTVQGFRVGLKIEEKVQNEMVKVTGDQGTPVDFTLWMQLKEAAPGDTRMRLVLHAELNMMMKMMVGKKIQDGIDKMAEKIADGFNNAPLYSGESFASSE